MNLSAIAAQEVPSPDADSAWDEALAWARTRAIPLSTCEPGRGFDDLRRLAPSIGSARIVALGEATHGTREFFQLKHRVFEYLVAEHGFRLFGLEASYAGCLPIDRYVQTGEGDVRALIKAQGFWTWDTAEVLDLVEWMRAHNAKHDASEDRVHFYGFDTQDAATPLRLALDVLGAVEPEEVERLRQRLRAAIETRYATAVASGTVEEYEAVLAAIDDMQRLLSTHRDALSDTEPGYAKLRLATEAGRHAVAISRPAAVDREAGVRRNVRDETMAEVVARILELHGEESRIMLWAHDGHVSKHPGDPARGVPMMGRHLETRFGDDYVPVGFSFARGGFQALYWPRTGETWDRRVLGEYRIDGVIPGSIDHLLSEVGQPLLFLDLRAERDAALPVGLTRARLRRSIGGLFDAEDADGRRFTRRIVFPEHFEAVVFVETTSRAVPLDPPATFNLGVRTADAADGGARVTEVAEDSIAERAGIEADDVLRRVDGVAVENTRDLAVALSRLDRPGPVVVEVVRERTDGSRGTETLRVPVPEWVRTR